MTVSLTSPALNRPAKQTQWGRILSFVKAINDRIDRIGLPSRLDRMSDDQLRSAGLHRADSDWLRGHGSSEETATRLAIRAGMRAGNW